MSKLRQNARGQQCQLRVPGVCNSNCETTVLAHLRLFGIAGMGQKPPDLCGVFACSDCHDWLDRRGRFPVEQENEAILRALLRTLVIQAKIGEVR